jgi:phosphoserine/homoserine phosphotransferase
MARILIVSNLEGIFIPELWPVIGQRLGIAELSATTRDTSDFRTLMRYRMEALQKNNVRFSTIAEVLEGVKPFKGAEAALFKLSSIPEVRCAIISDSFVEFIDIVLKEKYGWKIFANGLKINHDIIESCAFDVGGKKADVLKKVKEPSETMIGIGCSLNDADMLKETRLKILFNPVSDLRGRFSDSITCNNIETLVTIIHKLI